MRELLERRALDAVRSVEGSPAHPLLVEVLRHERLVWRDLLADVVPRDRALVLFGVSTWTRRSLRLDDDDELPLLDEVLSIELLARWLQRSIEAGDSKAARGVIRRHLGASVLVPPVVRALAMAGRVAEARAVIDDASWTHKASRALGVLELVRAGVATAEDVLDVITATPFVQTGHARGGDELEALVSVLQHGAACLPPDGLRVLVKAAVGLGARGQRTTRPTGFAKLLARASLACAEPAGASTPHLLDAAEQLRDAILFDDLSSPLAPVIAAARLRAEAPVVEATSDVSSWPRTPLEPDPTWKTEADPRRRAIEGCRAMVRALDADDAEAFFEALAVAIAPAAATHADRLVAWEMATPSERGARLLDLLRHDPTPDNRWCVLGSHQPWEELVEVDDRDAAVALVEVALERDLVTRAYPFRGDWQRPRSIAAQLARLAARHDLEGFLPRLLAATSASKRPGAGHRLFDALAVLAPVRSVEIDLEAQPTLPRWLGWALVARADEALEDLRARFGEPPPELVHRVCEELARAGRIDDAIACSTHPSTFHTFANGYESRPPPTQDALLAIARAAPLTPKQKKRVVAAFRKAPRKRGDGHAERLAELEALLAG